MNHLSVQTNFTLISLIDAGKNFAQCTLARAILTDKRMAAPPFDLKAHFIQSKDPGEMLGEGMEGEKGHGRGKWLQGYMATGLQGYRVTGFAGHWSRAHCGLPM